MSMAVNVKLALVFVLYSYRSPTEHPTEQHYTMMCIFILNQVFDPKFNISNKYSAYIYCTVW